MARILKNINEMQFGEGYMPKIAMVDDTDSRESRLVAAMIKQAGGKPVLLPRSLSERLLKSQGLNKKDMAKLAKAKTEADVREYEQQIAAATRLHLQYVARKLTYVDAVVLPGNRYDVPPSAYHDTRVHEKTRLAPPLDVRFQTELLLADYALHTRKIPVLGISGGMQLLVVKTGGRLIQHIDTYDQFDQQTMVEGTIMQVSADALQEFEDRLASSTNPELVESPVKANHSVRVLEGSSILGSIMKSAHLPSDTLQVFEMHHQGVAQDGVNPQQMKVTAVDSTGAVEAVEHVSHPFCLGVQFHPEFNIDKVGFTLIRELVSFAKFIKAPSKAQRKTSIPHYADWRQSGEQLAAVSA